MIGEVLFKDFEPIFLEEICRVHIHTISPLILNRLLFFLLMIVEIYVRVTAVLHCTIILFVGITFVVIIIFVTDMCFECYVILTQH